MASTVAFGSRRKKRSFYRALLVVQALFYFFVFFSPSLTAFAQAVPEEQPFEPITPELGVPIPGLHFTAASRDGGIVSIPYLAQYIQASYKYAVAIALIAAIVMVVWGGFRYLLGSADIGNLQRAKEIIRDAIAGMLLIIGAYLILQTVNPATTELRNLELSSVVRQNIDLQLTTTNAVTGVTVSEMDEMRRIGDALPPEEVPTDGSAAPSAPSSFFWSSARQALNDVFKVLLPQPVYAQIDGVLAQATGSAGASRCPLDLTAPYDERAPLVRNGIVVAQRSARTLEFLEEVAPLLTGGSMRERVLKAADAAAKCHVSMGSCNATVQTVNRAAGVSGLGRVVFEANGAAVDFMRSEVTRCSGDRRCNIGAFINVYQRLRSENPDYLRLISELQPGDAIYVFNGNGVVGGQHSAIFVSWCGTRGEACVVQGGRFSNGIWVRGDPRICIKPQCLLTIAQGGNGRVINPVTKIFRPE